MTGDSFYKEHERAWINWANKKKENLAAKERKSDYMKPKTTLTEWINELEERVNILEDYILILGIFIVLIIGALGYTLTFLI